MKKEFYMTVSVDNNNLKLIKKEGDLDSKIGIIYHKENNGWTATDVYTGRALVVACSTKKECQTKARNLKEQLDIIRNGEKYVQGYINYNEMLQDVKEEQA